MGWPGGTDGKTGVVMIYQQLRAEERFLIAKMRSDRKSNPEIAVMLGRHRTTIWRELQRNRAPSGCGYGHQRAQERAVARRRRSRRNRQFERAELGRVE